MEYNLAEELFDYVQTDLSAQKPAIPEGKAVMIGDVIDISRFARYTDPLFDSRRFCVIKKDDDTIVLFRDYSPNTTSLADESSIFRYDPTNGTISAGYVFRVLNTP